MKLPVVSDHQLLIDSSKTSHSSPAYSSHRSTDRVKGHAGELKKEEALQASVGGVTAGGGRRSGCLACFEVGGTCGRTDTQGFMGNYAEQVGVALLKSIRCMWCR